jgi:S-adenosylmethionine:tRNA-ribosyltransferase-isomerase (queuine synthetase)
MKDLFKSLRQRRERKVSSIIDDVTEGCVQTMEPEKSKASLSHLRQWKATMECHKPKMLGSHTVTMAQKHKKHLKHTQLVNFQSDEHTCRTARKLKETTVLVEAGFEYITEMECCKLFRKQE